MLNDSFINSMNIFVYIFIYLDVLKLHATLNHNMRLFILLFRYSSNYLSSCFFSFFFFFKQTSMSRDVCVFRDSLSAACDSLVSQPVSQSCEARHSVGQSVTHISRQSALHTCHPLN